MRQRTETVSPMSNEGRNSYVIQHIDDAFLALFSEKPISEISVSELCEKAGVGRASFYRNFSNMEEILRKQIRKNLLEWEAQRSDDKSMRLSRQIGLLFSHFEKHRDFYGILNKRNMIYLLKDSLVEIYGPAEDSPKINAYAEAFFTYSIYGWIEVWFKRGMQESSAEMEQMLRDRGL